MLLFGRWLRNFWRSADARCSDLPAATRQQVAWCWRRCARRLSLLVAALVFLDVSGLHRHLLERDYDTEFAYPLHGDVANWVERLARGERLPPAATPLRQFDHALLVTPRSAVCRDNVDGVRTDVRLLVLVKSAAENGARRRVIRRTWCANRAPVAGAVLIGCVFVAAVSDSEAVNAGVRLEGSQHADMLVADFHDNYFNNTLKLMTAMGWAHDQCSGAQLVLFVDDDFYVSMPNVLDVLSSAFKSSDGRVRASIGDRPLLLGYVFHSAPHRHRFSKWFVSLTEYPFSLWPPYCTAGAFVVSRHTLVRLRLASRFVRQFRFDDIYVGLLAKKLGVAVRHTERVLFWESFYDPLVYKDVAAAHGFADPQRLETVWNDQHRLGFA